MSELSRPFQVGLVLVLAFAALWFVALRKHSATPAPTPTHAANSAPAPHKSAIPGGLGRAVDKAGLLNALDRELSAPGTPASLTIPVPVVSLSPAIATFDAGTPNVDAFAIAQRVTFSQSSRPAGYGSSGASR